MKNAPVACVDYETRSACDLKKHGTWVYSQDPSTEVMCCAFRLPHWPKDKTAIWHPIYRKFGIEDEGDAPELVELFKWIQAGGLVEAHNSWFEYCMWRNIMVPTYGWPELPDHQWRCSAAKAASHALPRGLDDACSALMMRIRKDASGSKVMKKLTKPRKPRKAEVEAWKLKHGKKPHPRVYHESFDLFVQLWAYCCQDVLAEEALSAMIPDLSPEETELYLLDQKINARGFQLDSEAVETALALIAKETVILNGELKVLTGGKVDRATKRAQMVAWFAEHGLAVENTQALTLQEMLTWDWLPADVRRGVELMFMLGKSSTAKYEAMRNWSIGDWRVRGGLLYHGASTGRWPLTGDHDVLTPQGWVRLDEWTGGALACWDPSGEVSFETATRLIFLLAPHERLAHWTNQKVDQLSTSDHAMPVFVRERRSHVSTRVWGGGFARKTVSELSPGDRVPLCGLRTPSSWPLSEIATRVLIMTQADGHFVVDNGHHLRFGFRKARKIERCQTLLVEAGIPYSLFAEPNGTTRIVVRSVDYPDWLFAFEHKTFSWEWLNAPADLVFEELQLWDGCKSSPDGMEYSTCNRQNADIIQALAHMSDRTCRVHGRNRDPKWSVNYRCGVDHDPAPVTFRKPQRVWVQTEHKTVYCTETPTGYFLVRRNGKVWVTGNSGKGVQPHNFPKGDKSVSDMDSTWALLKTRDREVITGEWDSVMKPLSYALRGAIVPSSGKRLFVADYASIEARVLLWCADDQEGLDLFRTKGADPYCAMATEIYKHPCNKVDHPKERQLGKAAILGLGYQMGASRFVDSAKSYGVIIDEDFSQGVVDAFRAKFWRVKEMWYAMEKAAIEAIQTSKPTACGQIIWIKEGWFLYCYLPSGRRLAYPNPKVKMGRTSWGTDKIQLSFMGVSATTHQWCEQRTYGGMIVENIVQAISRDLMAAAMVRAEKTGIYDIVLTVHDEIVSQAHPLLGEVHEFEKLMAECPEWASGCPIAAEGWTGERYHK